MNFADIEIPHLFGGAKPGEGEKPEFSATSATEKNTEAIKELMSERNEGITNYFVSNSTIFLIIIVALVCMFIVFQTSDQSFTKLIKNGPVTILFFGSMSIVATCGLLLFFGYGSNEDIHSNFSYEDFKNKFS